MRKHLIHWLLALVLLLGAVPLSPAAGAAEAPDAWAAEEVALAVELGLVPDDLQSRYTDDITRAEFCRLAVICLGEAARVNGWTFDPAPASFDDTDDPDVLTAAGLGIVSGDGQGSFLPGKGITRQEAAVMLCNTLTVMGAPIAPRGAVFTDQAAIAAWASDAVSAVVGWGVMNGTGGGAFSPQGTYSRQQAYVTMYRLLSSVYMQMEAYSYTLQPGESLETGCYYATGEPAARWTSSAPDVVAVAADSGDGAVTLRAVAPGTATLTCRSGDYQLKCTVTVTAPAAPTVEYDFKGTARTHYPNDAAWDLCRQLEADIGIQIFYLPEFNDNVPMAQVTYATFDYVTLDAAYFQQVYNELVQMKAAFDLYPDGFLQQVVAKKGDRTTEIVLFPADMTFFDGTPYSVMLTGSFSSSGGFAGQHVYDESGMRIDRIYYTGTGSPYEYSHEMGHMVVSSAMIANGWTSSCNQWVGYSASYSDFVSSYAATSRPEDFAETWAYLWHHRDQVEQQLASGSSEGLRSKIAFLTQVLTTHYPAATWESLPWTYLL